MIPAPNPRLNASLNEGHALQSMIISEGQSGNPRLYAQNSGFGQFHPEFSSQLNDDLPPWVILGVPLDGVSPPPVRPDDPIYLHVWVGERRNFYNVAGVLALVRNGVALGKALS